MVVDDVGLSPGSAPHTATPTVTATVPASPSTSTTPKVKGTAEAGSSVTLYSNSTCTSAALGTGSAAEFAAAGITATVSAAAATTTIYAKAAKAGQNDSACSTTFVAYAHLGPPETTLVKTPKKKVSSRKRKEKVAFAFSSPTAGATFECSIDGKAFKAVHLGPQVQAQGRPAHLRGARPGLGPDRPDSGHVPLQDQAQALIPWASAPLVEISRT